MPAISIVISLFSLVYYFFFLLDPFKDNPRRRNSNKLIDNRNFLMTNVFVSVLLLAFGTTRLLYGDKGGFVFSTMPILFIVIYVLADIVSRKYYFRPFAIILRGDSLKRHSVAAILASFMVIALPLAIPIVLLLI